MRTESFLRTIVSKIIFKPQYISGNNHQKYLTLIGPGQHYPLIIVEIVNVDLAQEFSIDFTSFIREKAVNHYLA